MGESPADIHEVLREWMRRQRGGMSKKKFAEEVGIAGPDITNVELGKARPTLDKVMRIITARHMPLSRAFLGMLEIALELEKRPGEGEQGDSGAKSNPEKASSGQTPRRSVPSDVASGDEIDVDAVDGASPQRTEPQAPKKPRRGVREKKPSR